MRLRHSKRLSEISLFASGATYGFSTPVGRQMGVWMDPIAITAVRFLCALPFCLVTLRYSSRRIEASVVHLVPAGLLYGMAATLFTFALFETSIGVAIFCYYLANLLSSLLVGVYLNHEKLDRVTAIAFSSSVIAVVLIALSQDSGSSKGWAGFVLAALSGLSATAISQEQKRIAKHFDGETITLAQVVGGLGFCCIAVVVAGDYSFTELSGGGFGLAVVYGAMFWLCHRLAVFGFRDGPIGIGTVLLSVEVVTGPLLAWIFFDEGLGSLEILGGMFTAVAIAAAAKRSPAAEAEPEVAKAN